MNEKKDFGDRIVEILDGKHNDILIKKGYLSEEKRGSTLTNQEIMDIIKKKMGVEKGSKQSITDWMNGKSPKLNVVINLSELLDVSIDWLVGKDDIPTIEEETDYKPFKRFGFSVEAYESLKKHKEYHEALYNKYANADGQEVAENYMISRGCMNVLNLILQNTETDGEQVRLPILEGLERYLDVHSQENFYKIREFEVDTFSVFNPAISYSLDKDSSYHTPFSKEEIEEYVEYYNANCDDGKEIDIDSYNPNDDENCATYIKTKRITDRIMTQFFNSANLSTIEDSDANAFFFLKTQLVNAKVRQIEEILDAQRQSLRTLYKEENLTNKELIKKIEDDLDAAPKYAYLKKLLKYYKS